MKTLVRCAAAGAAVVALLTAALLLILGTPSETRPDGAMSTVIFTSGEPTDVKSVTVSNSGGSYSFYYEDDGYVLDDIPPAIADLDAFIAFMSNCARLSAQRQVSGKDEVLADYGLAEPAATAEITFFDETVFNLRIGEANRISQNYYIAVDGFDGVYVMSKALAEQFLLPKTQIISRNVTPGLEVTSPLSAVRDATFTGGLLAEPVTIRATAGAKGDVALSALSFGAATHIVQGAGAYQLDQTYGVEIIGSLFGIPAIDIAGYNLSGAEISAYGFDTPYMTVEYDLASADGPVRHMLLKLVKLDESRFYATLEGSGAVYLIGREAFLDLRYEKLLLRWFLTPLLMDLSSVTVRSADAEYRFDIDNTDPRNPVVTSDGQIIDIDLFRSFFRLATSAANDGNYPGRLEQPESGALLSITYEYLNPDKKPDIMELYPGEIRRNNVFINGVGEFAIKDSFASRIIGGCSNLLSGNPIEENW